MIYWRAYLKIPRNISVSRNISRSFCVATPARDMRVRVTGLCILFANITISGVVISESGNWLFYNDLAGIIAVWAFTAWTWRTMIWRTMWVIGRSTAGTVSRAVWTSVIVHLVDGLCLEHPPFIFSIVWAVSFLIVSCKLLIFRFFLRIVLIDCSCHQIVLHLVEVCLLLCYLGYGVIWVQ